MALEDAHAGLREGLDCGTQPDGTPNETDRERGQGGGSGEKRVRWLAHLEKVDFSALAIGTLVTANFTWSADRPVGCVGRSEPLRTSLVG